MPSVIGELMVSVFFLIAPIAAKLISHLIHPFIWGFSAVFFSVAVIGKYAGAMFIREKLAMKIAGLSI